MFGGVVGGVAKSSLENINREGELMSHMVRLGGHRFISADLSPLK